MISASQQFWFWVIVCVSLITLSAPTLVVLGASFTAGNIIAFPPEGLSLKWYEKIVLERDLRQAFLRSLSVSIICTLIAVPAGTLAGIALARYRLRFGNGLQMYLLLPFTIPLIGSGIGLMMMFGSLGALGSLWPVGFACAVINLPFMIWSVSSSAALLDPDLEHAAAIETGEIPCDRKPQSRAGFLAVPAFTHVEDDLARLHRNAGAVVIDQDSHAPFCRTGTARNFHFVSGMLESVIEQCCQDLVQVLAIACDADLGTQRNLHFDLPRSIEPLQGRRHLVRGDGNRGGISYCDLRRRGPRTRDLVVDVSLHFLDLRDDRGGGVREAVAFEAMGLVR